MVEKSDSTTQTLASNNGDTPVFALLRIGAYLAARFSGIRLGITKIWDMAYDNFKDYSQFNDLRSQRKVDLAKVPEDAKLKNWDRKTIATKIRDIERQYGKEFNRILKNDFKIDSEGPLGFLKGHISAI